MNLNSKYKHIVKELQHKLKPIVGRKDELFTDSITLKEELLVSQSIYKADKNDQVDVLLAEALLRRKSNIGMFLKRISPG